MNTKTINVITHYGREYQVEIKTDCGDCPYLITGPTGHRYALLRNKPKPHMLFPVRIGVGKFTVPRNWWFTDEGGTLRSLTP